jgi:transposase
MDEPVCHGCRELARQVAELRVQVEDLTRKLEATQRAGKRQAAPFSKGPPKPEPKPNGRKAGAEHGRHAHRAIPEHVDETHEAPLPPACAKCCGPLIEDDVVEQFQTDIPRQPILRKFRIHRGHCAGCGHTTQGRHPLQTSDAIGAAASQMGPEAQAAATALHTRFGLSHGKVAALFLMLFGITLSRGASARIGLRAATRLEGDYDEILKDVRGSPEIAADETGWRIGGHPAWLHVWVGERSTAYAIDPQRSADALERVIGRDWSGVLSCAGPNCGRICCRITAVMIWHRWRLDCRIVENSGEGEREGVCHAVVA